MSGFAPPLLAWIACASQDLPGQENEPLPLPRRLGPVERAVERDLPDSASFRASIELRSLRGSTRVRENDSLPDRLSLGDDLGFGAAPGLRFSFTDDTEGLRVFAEVEMVHGSGRGQIGHDFQYDEDRFKGGVPFTVSIDAFFARGGAAFKDLFGRGERGWIAPFIGFEYPRISLSIDQSAAGKTSGEQYRQMIPYPIAGLMANFELDPALTLDLRAYVGGLPSVPTPFTEGGRLSMSVETVNVEASLRWRLTGAVSVTLAAGVSAWHGTLTSREDGNDLRLFSPQATLGIEIRW